MKFKNKIYLIDFTTVKGEIEYHNTESLTFTLTEQNGKKVNSSEKVDISLTELRNELFMVSWKENSGKTIVQIQDFENSTVHSNITLPNGMLISIKGTLNEKK